MSKRMGTAALFVASLLSVLLVVAQPGRSKEMMQVDNATQHLQKFRDTNSLQELHQAVAELEAVDITGATGSEREQTTRAWINVLHTVEQVQDPAFDPSDLPAINVIPPTVNGVTYPAGVDPKAISDVRARAQYEGQLAQNRAKSERYSFQYGLRTIHDRATQSFEQYLGRFYRPSASDHSELERLLQEGHISAALSERIAASTRAP